MSSGPPPAAASTAATGSSSSGRGGGGGGRRSGGGGSGRGGGRGGGRQQGARGGGGGRGGGTNNNNKGGSSSSNNNNNNNNNAGGGGNQKQLRGGGGGGNSNQKAAGNNNNKGGKGRHHHKKDSKKDNTINTTAPLSEEDKKRLEQERLAKEAKARQEEEQKAAAQREKQAAAAAKARADQQRALDQGIQEDITTLATLIDAVHQHQVYRQSMSEPALQESRKSFERNKKQLKTDLKKCTAFVKKIKSGAAWSLKPADVVHDVASLNLSRYVEEVVTAVLEAKPKVTDLPVMVALTTAMHERYADYLPNLIASLWTLVSQKATVDTVKARRVYLRLWTEFLVCGVVTDAQPLLQLVVEAAGPKDGGTSYVVQDAHLLVAFTKQAGSELLGVTPTSVTAAATRIRTEYQRSMEQSGEPTNPDDNNKDTVDRPVVATTELVQSGMTLVQQLDQVLAVRAVDASVSKAALTHCRGAFSSLSDSLVQSHVSLQKMEHRCEQDRLVLGSLTEAREQSLADARKRKESLLKCVEHLADVLNQPLPQLQDAQEELNPDGPGIEVLTASAGGDGETTNLGPFDDEETRAFYCDIPDYVTTIPPALLGLSLEAIESKKLENMTKYGGDAADADMEDDTVVESDADLAVSAEGLDAELDATAVAGDGIAATTEEGEGTCVQGYPNVGLYSGAMILNTC